MYITPRRRKSQSAETAGARVCIFRGPHTPLLKENVYRKMREVFENIGQAIWNLPQPIRRVCYVQLFAFMGWFPFLFYAYVSILFYFI